MKEKHITGNESKRGFYAELEAFAREKIRQHLQDVLAVASHQIRNTG